MHLTTATMNGHGHSPVPHGHTLVVEAAPRSEALVGGVVGEGAAMIRDEVVEFVLHRLRRGPPGPRADDDH